MANTDGSQIRSLQRTNVAALSGAQHGKPAAPTRRPSSPTTCRRQWISASGPRPRCLRTTAGVLGEPLIHDAYTVSAGSRWQITAAPSGA